MLSKIQNKIFDRNSLAQKVQEWKANGDKVVFTNGCFDILHYGHVYYLAEARELGDRLIVAVNSDSSVRKSKGAHRPINDENARLFLLAGLEMVDAVVLFEEDTPIPLLELFQPDILVKGGDRTLDDIVGADLVLAYGGAVKSLTLKKGYSTTQIESKIRRH